MARVLLSLDKSTFDRMRRLICYLIVYGNTRLDDLVSFGSKSFHNSKRATKALVERMVVYGLIERICHDRLEPAVTYIKKGDTIPIDMELAAIAGMQELVNLEAKDPEVAKAILKQADLISTIKSDGKTHAPN